jgi:hypothetical protein
VNPCGISRDDPGATLREKTLGEFVRNSRKGGARYIVEARPGHSGRSMLRPYGILLRQRASGRRKREQAPALQRNVAMLNLEIGGRENQKRRPFVPQRKPALRKAERGISLRLGGATAGAASSAPTEFS